jgi:hypothetical protein
VLWGVKNFGTLIYFGGNSLSIRTDFPILSDSVLEKAVEECEPSREELELRAFPGERHLAALEPSDLHQKAPLIPKRIFSVHPRLENSSRRIWALLVPILTYVARILKFLRCHYISEI